MQKQRKKEVNLFTLILQDESSGLNIEGVNDISGVLKGNNEPIKSNKDEPEILIYIKFSCLVNITKILVDSKAPKEENKPEILKIFANSSNMDFSDAVSNSATETIKLEDKYGNKIGLNVSKFRKISELVMYFTKEDSEFIQLDSIQFYGSLGDGVIDIGELQKKKAKDKKK